MNFDKDMFRGVDLLGDKRDYLDIMKEIQQLDKQIGTLAGRRSMLQRQIDRRNSQDWNELQNRYNDEMNKRSQGMFGTQDIGTTEST